MLTDTQILGTIFLALAPVMVGVVAWSRRQDVKRIERAESRAASMSAHPAGKGL